MKTCVSCKHFAKPDKIPETYGKCKAPQSYTTSLVTGKAEKQEFELCHSLRSEIPGYPTCGVNANWWEPLDGATEIGNKSIIRESKHSLLKRLISWIKRSQNDLST